MYFDRTARNAVARIDDVYVFSRSLLHDIRKMRKMRTAEHDRIALFFRKIIECRHNRAHLFVFVGDNELPFDKRNELGISARIYRTAGCKSLFEFAYVCVAHGRVRRKQTDFFVFRYRSGELYRRHRTDKRNERKTFAKRCQSGNGHRIARDDNRFRVPRIDDARNGNSRVFDYFGDVLFSVRKMHGIGEVGAGRLGGEPLEAEHIGDTAGTRIQKRKIHNTIPPNKLLNASRAFAALSSAGAKSARGENAAQKFALSLSATSSSTVSRQS